MTTDAPSQSSSPLRPLAQFRLRRYEARLGLLKVIWGTTAVGLVAALLPALVEFYKKIADGYQLAAQQSLEKQRFELERIRFYQTFLQTFADKGYNQDIELRIRLAEYFAAVSEEDYAVRWRKFLEVLEPRRALLYKRLDELVVAIAMERGKETPDIVSVAKYQNEIYRIERQMGAIKLEHPSITERLIQPTRSTKNAVDVAYLLKVFGQPAQQMSDLCRAPDNELLASQLDSANVGPFTVRMIKPAIASLKAIFSDIGKDDPELWKGVGTLGALCVRYVRGTTRPLIHSFGVAIDLTMDGKVLQYGRSDTSETWQKMKRVADYFERAGWVWGGNATVPDPASFDVSAELFESWLRSGEVKGQG